MGKFTIDFGKSNGMIRINMKTIKRPNSLTKITILIAIFLAVITYLFYHYNQYGTFHIQNTQSDNLSVFVDNQEKKINEDLIFKTKKGEHSIILSQNNFWPWTKTITIEPKSQTEINPFFVPQNTSGMIIGDADPEYYSILSLFNKNLINSEIINKINNPTLTEKITALDYYKDRDDIVVMAIEEGVYAMEITQENLQPIYKGSNPKFVKNNNDTLYILDNNSLMIVNY